MRICRLLERLKFLAIVGSNLDEFFLVRVAWLMQRRAAKARRRDPSGMTPAEQLAAISRRAHRMVDEQSAGVRDVFGRLAEHGLHLWRREQWTDEHRQFAAGIFRPRDRADPDAAGHPGIDTGPLLPNLQLHVAGPARRVAAPGETPEAGGSSSCPCRANCRAG